MPGWGWYGAQDRGIEDPKEPVCGGGLRRGVNRVRGCRVTLQYGRASKFQLDRTRGITRRGIELGVLGCSVWMLATPRSVETAKSHEGHSQRTLYKALATIFEAQYYTGPVKLNKAQLILFLATLNTRSQPRVLPDVLHVCSVAGQKIPSASQRKQGVVENQTEKT